MEGWAFKMEVLLFFFAGAKKNQKTPFNNRSFDTIVDFISQHL